MSQAQAPAPRFESPLNLVMLALSVGAIVIAAMTLSAFSAVVIPFITVCLTLSLLGAATKQPHALLGWIAAGLSAVALVMQIIALVA